MKFTMKSKIFVDSSFWLALFNKEDALHKQALSFSQDKKFLQAALFTSDHVLDETLTRLKKKVNAKSAFLLFEALQRKIKEDRLTFLFTTHEIFNKAYKIFKNNPLPKSFSFTDATIVALVKAHKINTLLTFDEDFKKIKPKIHVLP